MSVRLPAILFVCVAFAGITRAQSAQDRIGRVRATGLRCEYRVDPLGVEEASPRLTWIVESDRRAEAQTAYRVLVASSREVLARDEGDLWDSGRVESSESAHVAYAGRALASRQVCHWKVMAWDREGERGPWSEPARWEMGLLAPADWRAEWIAADSRRAGVEIERATYFSIDGAVRADVTARVREMVARGEAIVASNEALGGDPARDVLKRLSVEYRVEGAPMRSEVAEGATAALAADRIPYLRRALMVRGRVARARLFVTALGVYEAYLNGMRIGDERLAPGWTDYRQRVQYQVYDVTTMLRPGENALGAIVGPGWFAGRAGLFHARAFYGDRPALLAQLEIEYQDGGMDRVVTDGSWVRRDGPILAADIMDGEMHDARRELAGWCEPGADVRGWSPVEVVEEGGRSSQVDAPVRTLMELPAISVTEPALRAMDVRPGRTWWGRGCGFARLRARCSRSGMRRCSIRMGRSTRRT
ncbi:MAG: alpha-L-rhamnosidase N-terminal domain-containing protein [Phycisphaeraceae bacterium]|nr:alpha-L-rhamnosidase N-terminal domain-containing protein [Phycisphaeraceae bacterium]